MTQDAPAPDGPPGVEDEAFVIEELSRRTGITVRSLRSYQSRKLLPPPTVRGRTGYYDARHVARIQLIQDLQAEGFKLNAIARMLDERGRSDAELLRFTRTVRDLFDDEEAGAVTTMAELSARFGVDRDAGGAVLERAEKLGLIRRIGGDRVEEVAPRLIRAGERAAVLLGLDAREALDVVEQLRKHAEGVAALYLDLFLRRAWTPFVEAGQPPEDWPRLQQGLEDVRGLATEALVGAFELVMAERATAAFGRELVRPRHRRRG